MSTNCFIREQVKRTLGNIPSGERGDETRVDSVTDVFDNSFQLQAGRAARVRYNLTTLKAPINLIQKNIKIQTLPETQSGQKTITDGGNEIISIGKIGTGRRELKLNVTLGIQDGDLASLRRLDDLILRGAGTVEDPVIIEFTARSNIEYLCTIVHESRGQDNSNIDNNDRKIELSVIKIQGQRDFGFKEVSLFKQWSQTVRNVSNDINTKISNFTNRLTDPIRDALELSSNILLFGDSIVLTTYDQLRKISDLTSQISQNIKDWETFPERVQETLNNIANLDFFGTSLNDLKDRKEEEQSEDEPEVDEVFNTLLVLIGLNQIQQIQERAELLSKIQEIENALSSSNITNQEEVTEIIARIYLEFSTNIIEYETTGLVPQNLEWILFDYYGGSRSDPEALNLFEPIVALNKLQKTTGITKLKLYAVTN